MFRILNLQYIVSVAGVAGFEPTNDGVRASLKAHFALKNQYFRGFLPQYANYTQACVFFLDFINFKKPLDNRQENEYNKREQGRKPFTDYKRRLA